MSCSGTPCSKVTYDLVSIGQSLEYNYTPPPGGSAPSSGTINPGGNNDYTRMWLGSFLLWMMPSFGFFVFSSSSPFQNVEPTCSDGCECDLGPPVPKLKEYTYTDTFTLDSGATIRLSGTFTMNVTSQSGVCTLKAGTEHSMRTGNNEQLFAMLATLNDLGSPADIANQCKDKEEKS